MSKLTWLIGFGVVLVLGLLVAQPIALHTVLYDDNVTVTVTDKERICESSTTNKTDCKYIVFTEDETFENTDSLWFLKFDSSDVYRTLVEGKTYNVEVTGMRIPFLSMYRNIISVNNASAEEFDHGGNMTVCANFQAYADHVHQHVRWNSDEEPYKLEERIREVLCD